MLFFLPCLSLLLALLLFRQLSFVKASQKFPRLVSCSLHNDENRAVCTPSCILVEYDSFNLPSLLSFLCLYDLVSVR